jgi:WD40 repeat protein
MAIWDINSGQALRNLGSVHHGPVSKIKFFSDGGNNNVILSAGLKDGCLAAHDMRSMNVIFKKQVHGGAINLLDVTATSHVVTGASDKQIKTFDIFR